jgi:predicted transcriptional regulator of viral defense system
VRIPDELDRLFGEHSGLVTTRQANVAGLSNERLRLLADAGEIERVGQGVYMRPDEFLDAMVVMQLRRPRIVYSHETALFLHGLTDRDPVSYTVTVPNGYNTARLRADGVNVFTVSKDLYGLGIVRANTPFGNAVKVYDRERTVCDCLRSRNRMDTAIVMEGLKRYARSRDRDLNRLTRMADTFHVSAVLMGYLEVLL